MVTRFKACTPILIRIESSHHVEAGSRTRGLRTLDENSGCFRPQTGDDFRMNQENRNGRILVIGGGIVGLAVATELQSAGHPTLLIDKGEPGTGCSYANAGWITPCFAMPLPQPGMLLKSIGWLLDSESPLYIKPAMSWTLIRWLIRFTFAMNRRQMMSSVAALTDISKESFTYYSNLNKRMPDVLGYESKGLLMVGATASGIKYARKEMELMAGRGIRGQYM
jgi:D-amino-acid dehydrogenase